jgi:hypothetical protein
MELNAPQSILNVPNGGTYSNTLANTATNSLNLQTAQIQSIGGPAVRSGGGRKRRHSRRTKRHTRRRPRRQVGCKGTRKHRR